MVAALNFPSKARSTSCYRYESDSVAEREFDRDAMELFEEFELGPGTLSQIRERLSVEPVVEPAHSSRVAAHKPDLAVTADVSASSSTTRLSGE